MNAEKQEKVAALLRRISEHQILIEVTTNTIRNATKTQKEHIKTLECLIGE